MLNDQGFSRISVALGKQDCYTVEDLKRIIGESQTPSPVVEELGKSLDFKSWLEPNFVPHIKGITKTLSQVTNPENPAWSPQQFLFEKDESPNSVGASMRTSIRSNQPLSDSKHLLTRLPSTPLSVRAGVAVFSTYQSRQKAVESPEEGLLEDGTEESPETAAARDDAATTFQEAEKQLERIATRYFLTHQKQSWERRLAQIKEYEKAPAHEYTGWYPLEPQDVLTVGESLTPVIPPDPSACTQPPSPFHPCFVPFLCPRRRRPTICCTRSTSCLTAHRSAGPARSLSAHLQRWRKFSRKRRTDPQPVSARERTTGVTTRASTLAKLPQSTATCSLKMPGRATLSCSTVARLMSPRT